MRGLEASSPTNPAAVRVAGAYGLLALLATVLAFVLRDGLPWEHPAPWLPLRGPSALALSLLLGVAIASGVIFATRMTVPRFAWARRLHNELRPVARDLSLGHILALAGLSSLGEELLFRGVLVPLLGVLAAGVVFGLVHQMRGPSRWVWVGWAAGVGVALGAVFALTGSLVGPLVAHAVINAVNLTFLRDHDFDDVPARSIV
jgi:membrane protease YdiL (CAAX protease family)